ncbi:hypothetical protein FRB96_007435 [Tulasnella sp. 330]|nr:hypothetical protein FRB96_007435 [Tulasnella sp. 330]KAG8880088.1 hypothetical protein FRB97_001074 [Tulasnella sp. 331]KAG8886754.1 hypothetical protein FRB98_001019 [Tulasnella sp. 332]
MSSTPINPNRVSSRSGLPSHPNGVGPCPKTLKSILRSKLCYKHSTSSTTSIDSHDSGCRSVKFCEDVDEHLADEWDRSSCAVACPTSRDIWELKQIQRELLPNGCGVIQDDSDQAQEDEYYFDIFGGDDDVDCSQRRSRVPPSRKPKKLLNRIPLELCPLLPSAATPCDNDNLLLSTPITPNNSVSHSPLDSPPHGSPVLAPVKDQSQQKNKRGGKMMTFMPLLPATESDPKLESSSATVNQDVIGSHSIPTPPQTPTLTEKELPGVQLSSLSLSPPPSPTHAIKKQKRPSFEFLPCGPAKLEQSQSQPQAIHPRQQQQHHQPRIVGVKEIPSIQLSSSTPCRTPPLHRLALLPNLPYRSSTPPRSTASQSSAYTTSTGRSPPIPAMMKTGTAAPIPMNPTASAPGFMPFAVSFKAAGRI